MADDVRSIPVHKWAESDSRDAAAIAASPAHRIRSVATAHRWMITSFASAPGLLVVAVGLVMLEPTISGIVLWTMLGAYFAGSACAIGLTIAMQRCGWFGIAGSAVLIVSILVPILNLLIFIVLSKSASDEFRCRGVRPGLLGVPKRKYPLFDRVVCRRCQYDLAGNTTGVCPECGMPTAPPRSPNCPICYYDLTDNTSGICPECGTPIASPPS